MAAVPNGYGESIPDSLTVHLTFDDDGHLTDCDAPVGTWPKCWGAFVATIFTSMSYGPRAVVAPGPVSSQNFNTLKAVRHSFTYLDCGRWGGDLGSASAHRDFGIVWGTWAALCQFIPPQQGGGKPAVVDKPDNPINEIINALCVNGASVRLMKPAVWSGTPDVEPDWNTVYVFVPDLHLPVANRKPNIQDQENWSEIMGQLVVTHTVGNPEPWMGQVDLEPRWPDSVKLWYERYLRGDIFQSAGGDLVAFLDRLASCQLKQGRKLRLVQLGDMYDLWIGLERFFEYSDDQVVLLKSEASRFVDYWVGRTNQANAPLIEAFERFARQQPGCLTLWGNHDNYMAKHVPAGTPSRTKEIHTGGIFVEHGHRGDDANRDGATKGHSVTNSVFRHPRLRSFDPNRRQYFTTTAALSYTHMPDFCVYVMGHTHSPILTTVNLEVSRAAPPPEMYLMAP